MELFRPNVVARLLTGDGRRRKGGRSVKGLCWKAPASGVSDEKTRSQKFPERGLDRVLSVMRCQPGVKRAQSCWIVFEKPPQDID